MQIVVMMVKYVGEKKGWVKLHVGCIHLFHQHAPPTLEKHLSGGRKQF